VFEAEQAAQKAEQESLKYQEEQAYKKEQDQFANDLATKKFEEDKRQFGQEYALSQQKAASSGAGSAVSGGGSNITQAVISNPALFSTLTPTLKGQVIREMQALGVDTTPLTIPQLNNAQREQIDSFDTLKREAQLAKTYLDSGLNTGIVASNVAKGSAALGGAKEFTQYRSSLDNLGSILIKARSGAAVTPQEFERIKGFIPGVNDDEKTATTKINRFFSELEAAQQNYIKRATQTSQQIVSPQKSSSADPLGIR